MIDILKSFWNTIYGVVRWVVSTLYTAIKSMAVINKIYLFIGDFLYLIPGFLAWFAVMFMIIYILNRVLNGRN